MSREMPSAPKERVVITVSADRPLEEVAREVATAGADVVEVLTHIGIITGDADADTAERLRLIRGVVDVSRSHSIHLDPLDPLS
jgi:hypothetical protein